MHPRLAGALAALALFACSGGGSKDGPDDPVVPEPAPVAADAVGIPPGTPLTFALPAAAAASSFTPANAVLRHVPSQRDLDTTAALDAVARTITVRHAKLLATGTDYELRVTGLRNDAGADVPLTIAFRTATNPARREFLYDRDPPPGEPERLPYRYEYETDALGHLTAIARYWSKGPDDRWFTADDPMRSWSRYEGTPEDATFSALQFYDAGPDAIWRTGDDLPAQLTTWYTDAHRDVRLRVTHSYGADRTPGTLDDRITCQRSVEDALGRLETRGSCGPGADQVFDTPDDTYAIQQRWVSDGDDLQEFLAYDTGPDGVAGNADDRVSQRSTFTYAGTQATATTMGYGPDRAIGTADDVFRDLWIYDHGPDGRLLKEDLSIQEGADGIPGTADDNWYFRGTYAYDAKGFLESYRLMYSYMDGKLGTADDLVDTEREYFTDR